LRESGRGIEIAVAIIGGGVGLATGIVGTLLSPWTNWRAEKTKLQQERRLNESGDDQKVA
jgi:hypothetical protein